MSSGLVELPKAEGKRSNDQFDPAPSCPTKPDRNGPISNHPAKRLDVGGLKSIGEIRARPDDEPGQDHADRKESLTYLRRTIGRAR